MPKSIFKKISALISQEKKEEPKKAPIIEQYIEASNWHDFLKFTGEKTFGELNISIPIQHDYFQQLTNGFNSYGTAGITRMIINKMVNQIIGSGLRIESQIEEKVLSIYDINISREQVRAAQTDINSLFNLYLKSKTSSYSSDESINTLAKTAFKYSVLGDCLVILRTYNQNVTVQLIDGLWIRNSDINIPDSHTLRQGIETNKRGEIVAFHVLNADGIFQRVLARDRVTGLERAFLIKSLAFKIGEKRGLSQIGPNLEKINKMDRYEEATVKGEEERAKLAFFIEHDKDAIGADPLTPGAKLIERNINRGEVESSFDQAEKLCTKWNRSIEGTYLNLNPGSSVKAFAEAPANSFPEFSKTIFGYISGSLQIPPEVALSMYNSNYSASRAAIQDWAETVDIYRTYFAELFYKKIYEFWLFKQHVALKQNGGFIMSIPGYVDAFNANITPVIDAYTNCRFVGRNRPFIDPLKEVNAIRRALGDKFNNVPLITFQQAIEKLGNGDYSTLIETIETELQQYKIEDDE